MIEKSKETLLFIIFIGRKHQNANVHIIYIDSKVRSKYFF